MSVTLELAKQLIEISSVTPDDKGCQKILSERLATLGFNIEELNFGEVSNLWAVLGDSGPLLVFAGHTDVVPAGPVEEWTYDPFAATEHEGFLYGRGAADMKSSLAAMVTAVERFQSNNQSMKGRIGFLITSDEEGIAIDGTRRVMEVLQERGTDIDYCVVGEPSSTDNLGDTIKIGRRGSLSGNLKIIGIKGHVAYPHLASNPIHKALPALSELAAMEWDAGNNSFPPTSFQISNVHAGVGANNVIPGTMELEFNLRYSTELDAETIKQRVATVLDAADMEYELRWHLSGEPFLTSEAGLIDVISQSVQEITGTVPEQSTSGGTSDGRFIAPTGTQVVELGPCNATIHKVDERVRIEDIDKLSAIYESILLKLFAS